MAQANLIKLRLSLKGRPIQSFTFDKEVITVGRDPNSDIFIDNPAISREHLKLVRTPSGGYRLLDLGSANGTFLNEERIVSDTLHNEDVVRFGKYTLWVSLEGDRRHRDGVTTQEPAKASSTADMGTVILSTEEIERMMTAAGSPVTQSQAAAQSASAQAAAQAAAAHTTPAHTAPAHTAAAQSTPEPAPVSRGSSALKLAPQPEPIMAPEPALALAPDVRRESRSSWTFLAFVLIGAIVLGTAVGLIATWMQSH